MEIMQEFLIARYEYRDGVLYYRQKQRNGIPAGAPVGTKDKDGYLKTLINRKPFRVHKLIWVMHGGQYSDLLDHADRNPSNNRLENLRKVTHSENNLNRGTHRRNKIGVKGVCYISSIGKYKASLQVSGFKHHLGYFNSVEEAKVAHESAIDILCPEHGAK